jgi:phage tail sheath gpL-like
MQTMITMTHGSESQYDLEREILAEMPNRFQAGQKLMQYVRTLMSGAKRCKVQIGVNPGVAAGTVTLASHVATNTVTINGVVFTCVASGATGNQYNVGTDTVTAANLAAAINASVTAKIAGYVTAVANGAVVTVTAVMPGLAANMFTLAISANGSVSGATLSGGDNGATQRTHYYGSAS